MPAVMEQIGKMSRAEQIRIARLILESIENGEVLCGGEGPSAKRLNVGLMKDEISLPPDFDEAFGSLDKSIADELIEGMKLVSHDEDVIAYGDAVIAV